MLYICAVAYIINLGKLPLSGFCSKVHNIKTINSKFSVGFYYRTLFWISEDYGNFFTKILLD